MQTHMRLGHYFVNNFILFFFQIKLGSSTHNEEETYTKVLFAAFPKYTYTPLWR